MSKNNKNKRSKYTLEFKQDAAKLVLENGYSQQQAADHLGISLSAIRRWVTAERNPTNKPDLTGKKTVLPLADQAELIRMRKEIERK